MSKYRFDLDHALAAWRRSLEYNHAFTADDLDELEQHLRDQVAGLVADGLSEEAAFRHAMGEMGDYGAAEAEYRKVYWGKRRRRGELGRELLWRTAMLKNYLKITFRSLQRQKGYAFLNIAGLTLGMACCLLLFQYVAYETSYDQFNSKRDRIVRPVLTYTQNGVAQDPSALQGYMFGPTMAQEVPGIVRYARIHPNYGDAVISYEEAGSPKTFTESRVLFVDSTFLSMFDYPLVHGNRTQVLRQPQTLLMSASTARKYFGDEEAIGKNVVFTGWIEGLYTVSGVFDDPPATSHLQFDVLLSMEDLLRDSSFHKGDLPWGWQNFVTYFEMAPNADRTVAEVRLAERYSHYRQDSFERTNTEATAFLQPLTEIHLNDEVFAPVAVTTSRRTVYFFTMIGLITLVIALVNYVNLSTARAMDRSKEVGVRKVVGAQKGQLIGQFLMESALMNLLALGLAVGLSLLLLPIVNRMAGVEMSHSFWLNGGFWAVFLGVFGVGALLAGFYPAFMLASFRPASVLKGKAGAFTSRVLLRKGLVVVQFTASIALLVGTLVVYAQLSYMRGLDTGLDLEQVLVVEGPKVLAEGREGRVEVATLKNELLRLSAIQKASTSGATPGRDFDWSASMHRVNADPSTKQQISVTSIDEDFATVYGLNLVAGEEFRAGMVRPDSGAVPVLVNEALVQALGFASNEEAVHAQITNGATYIIQGVFEDFHWFSAHQKAAPAMFRYDQHGGDISMTVRKSDLPETIAAIETTYKSLFPGNPFNFYFADASFDAQYKTDQRFATLFGTFASVAILIACLGLFGLAAYTAEQRTKEIGVRKVLGASVGSIVGLLAKDFLILVGIAFFLATPAAYFYMDNWLADFAYQIDLGPGVFLLAGSLALLIAWLTVSFQSVKAALADPVKSLRYE